MTLLSEIEATVKKIFADQWSVRDGKKVPVATEVKLSNDAVKLDGTLLYADLDGSTAMVDTTKRSFAAEVYKTYLASTAKIIKNEGGEIVSYDGDRVMAVFIGERMNTRAALCGLKINWAVKNIVNPALNKQYPDSSFVVRQVVGIDTGELFIARTGIRGDNDLVWVGPAANYAAKLTELSADYATRMTHRVFDKLAEDAKIYDDRAIWELATWNTMDNLKIYRSKWSWKI